MKKELYIFYLSYNFLKDYTENLYLSGTCFQGEYIIVKIESYKSKEPSPEVVKIDLF